MSCGAERTLSLWPSRGGTYLPPVLPYLVDDLLLLGMFLPQAGHFPPQGLILAVTHKEVSGSLFQELGKVPQTSPELRQVKA